MKYNDLLVETNKVVEGILGYLRAEFNKDKGFSGRSFYGETFAAATLALRDQDPKWQQQLLKTFNQREAQNSAHHEEFNNFALLEILSITTSSQVANQAKSLIRPYHLPFFRKVSNWVLLRNLVRLKQKSRLQHLVAKLQILIVLSLNQYQGFITDNTLRSYHKRKDSLSSQYHGFANLLVYLISQQTTNSAWQERFLRGLDLLIAEQLPSGELNIHGRGQKQIFGYAVILYSVIEAFKLTGSPKYLDFYSKGLKYLATFQNSAGYIPLVLIKDQSKKEKYWHSYNNDFDYLPFLAFWLQKSCKTLEQL